ncbi:hypothetical protein R1sor_008967 [Riccia sorocarpa]|uniref:Uncharacterized protein n=1 Tax=Riccia sorocarpa TaxID=122646 RepID=A0ABD3H522_9MARC
MFFVVTGVNRKKTSLSTSRVLRIGLDRKKHDLYERAVTAEELVEDPQSFWMRLGKKRLPSDLPNEILLDYVKKLYFFEEARTMPVASGQTSVFTKGEVASEMSQMSSGKAADLEGITVELLRWGGPTLLAIVIQLINLACQTGLPAEWTFRSVVPLYKSGPRSDPGSYRTIMVANTFSKVLGRLVESSSFSELEVSDELRRMASGRAADLLGMSIELLQWGNPTLVSRVTLLINQACQETPGTEESKGSSIGWLDCVPP